MVECFDGKSSKGILPVVEELLLAGAQVKHPQVFLPIVDYDLYQIVNFDNFDFENIML